MNNLSNFKNDVVALFVIARDLISKRTGVAKYNIRLLSKISSDLGLDDYDIAEFIHEIEKDIHVTLRNEMLDELKYGRVYHVVKYLRTLWPYYTERMEHLTNKEKEVVWTILEKKEKRK